MSLSTPSTRTPSRHSRLTVSEPISPADPVTIAVGIYLLIPENGHAEHAQHPTAFLHQPRIGQIQPRHVLKIHSVVQHRAKASKLRHPIAGGQEPIAVVEPHGSHDR